MATFASPFAQYTDASGNPGSGAKLYFYAAGSTTLITIYSDAAFSTTQANPVIADAAGQWPAVYVNTALYKVVMKSAADVTIRSADNLAGAPVSGPATATDMAAARFDLPTGKLLQNSVVIIDDAGNVTGVLALTATGGIAGTTGTFSGAVSGTTGTFSGVVQAANGTAAAPGFKFASSQSGIYRLNGAVGFSVAGVSKGAVHSTGFTVADGSSTDSLISADGNLTGGSISSDGNVVSYATTGVNLALGRNGDGTVSQFRRNGVTVGTIVMTGGTTAYNTSSDKALKTNWQLFDAGAIIDRLEAWRFDWKNGGSGYGVLAQDAYEVFPDAITPPSEDTDIWQADYAKFVPLLLAEIKELRRRFAELHGRLAGAGI
jgi:hypothetical protein